MESSGPSWNHLLEQLWQARERAERGIPLDPSLELAWAEMVRRVRVLAGSTLRNSSIRALDTDELTQTVLLRLQKTDVLARLMAADRPLRYLVQITHNAAIDLARRELRIGGRFVPDSEATRSANAVAIDLWQSAYGSGYPSRHELEAVISRLSKSEQLLLRKRFWDGATTREIAQDLNLSYSAVAVRLHRLLKRLNDLLSPAERVRQM